MDCMVYSILLKGKQEINYEMRTIKGGCKCEEYDLGTCVCFFKTEQEMMLMETSLWNPKHTIRLCVKFTHLCASLHVRLKNEDLLM